MVYYYTSWNVKLIQSLMQEYRGSIEVAPQEFISACFENRFQNFAKLKLQWIKDVFLGTHNHVSFLKKITREAGKFTEAEEDYFVIIAYGMIFQISPKNVLDLVKCLFNLDQKLFSTFILFFSNKGNVENISLIAQKEYDMQFVSEKILIVLFSWQPILFEITKTYKKYLNKDQSYHQKQSTLLINRSVTNDTVKIRKNRGLKICAPNFTPDVKFKVYTDTKIRKHNFKRKKNISGFCNMKIKNNNYYYSMDKTIKNSNFVYLCNKLKMKNINSLISVKETPTPRTKTTKSVVKKLHNIAKKCEQNELKWFYDIVSNCENTLKVEKLLKFEQQEKEKIRLLNMKRNYLMAQISHEDAIIAKRNVHNENKRKYNEFIKEKELWEKEIEDWKLKQTEHNRKQVEKMILIELSLINSRNVMIEKKKEMAEIVRYDTKVLKEKLIRKKEADLERKINIIKEIKTLSLCAKHSKTQKTVNSNESSGFGFLCEMTMAELHERLSKLKISLQEELDVKKNKIKTLHVLEKQDLEETKKSNDIFLSERERIRHINTFKMNKDVTPTDEISQLQKILEKKRNKRMLLTKENT